ncbi:outer membrane beta-barrel protein [Arachidicoccus sp.]|uniref:outer membrane beta-barrel protein n=1 Tax=Arachidicoccus sp. TaxID=1872624 RepID=UPI003D1D14A4
MPKKFKDMNDEELDKLFRESMENFTPPHAPEEAWDNFFDHKLSPRKDRKKNRFQYIGKLFPSRATRSWQLLSMFAIIAFVCIWLGLEKFGNKSNILKNQIVVSTKNEQNKNDSNLQNNSRQNEFSQMEDSSNSASGLALKEKGIIIYPNENANNLSSNDADKEINKTAINTSPEFKNDLAPNFLNPLGILDPKDSNKANRPEDQKKYAKNDINRTADSSKKAIILPYLSNKPIAPLKDNREFAMNDDDNKNRNNNTNWQVGVVGGSNLSIIKGNVSQSPGLNTGVILQRRINKSRFSLQTGIVRESMNYAVDNNNFHPDGKDISSEVSNITGSCTMVDVPVNVRYDIVQSKKNSAFVSTGVSATWMVDQSYNYAYAKSDGSSAQINKDVTGQGKNVYAVTNVSLGYEYHFNKMALEVAPYVKIPLGNIGYGNLSLGSVGAQISIKQSF